MRRTLLLMIVGLMSATVLRSVAVADDAEFFETRIRPVLVTQCYECHSAASAEVKGGLLVDFRDGLLQGGESGPAVVPGQPADSLLLGALRHESFEMPPAGKLADDVIADFEQWIQGGAYDPRDSQPSPLEAAEAAWKIVLQERARWWSLQPPVAVAPPDVTDRAWSVEPVDRFVRSALDAAGLDPAPAADGATLARRLAFVLTGLPPTPQQAQSFPVAYAADPDGALAAFVEELLASPQFGERMARHWMDVVRYTDTYGYEWDNPAKGSWEYRDYLVRAFNNDVGFDQFLREQVAGDLLPEPRIDAVAGVNESLIGPMFYHLGEHRHGSSLDFNGIHQEMVNNKIDAFSKAFLAMTVACSRCHDHKLDAVSQADYYALAGVFMTPRWTSRVIDAPGTYDAPIAELKRLRWEIHATLRARWQAHVEQGGLNPDVLQAWAAASAAAFDKLPLDDVAYPMAKVHNATDDTIPQVWGDLIAQLTAESAAREAANAQKFTVLTDFAQPGFPDGWVVEGDGIAHGYINDGSPLVSLDGDSLIRQVLARGYHTHALSSKLPGAVRLPPQEQIPGKFVSLRLNGGEFAGAMVVPQNAFQNEPMSFFDPAAAASWTEFGDRTPANGVTRVLVDVMTSPLHPNFPPRTGLAKAGDLKLPDNDLGLDKRSWFSLTGIVTYDETGSPQPSLDLFAALGQGVAPATTGEAWERVSEWLKGAVTRWAAQQPTDGDVRVVNWLLGQRLLPNDAAAAPEIKSLVDQYRAVEATVGFPRTVNTLDERHLAAIDYGLNLRGNVDDIGPSIPHGYLEVFARQNQVGAGTGSGRLELAQYLSSRENPQTARVYVNRLWQWVFGTGIVATSSDFGKLGDRPSHPELLDWLAIQFMDEGWSTKSMIRRLVLSRTFRQSGAVTAAGQERDPGDRMLHHYPTRRLEAEAIRDNLLAVSGRLDPCFGGPPIKPVRTVEDASKRLFSGPVDGNGRRSIYLEMSIMDPPKFLVGFNLPDLKLPAGKRDVTNVPAQALILLNDPFVLQSARTWADQLLQDGSTTPEERIRSMFVKALGRVPDDVELDRWQAAVSELAVSGDVISDRTAWTELAHAMFNTKEFVYYK
ncbi:MAG: PSD1 domain-containing protein [Planctomycetaceae bacterium]|nr:PSD1 domain-containing protein [Planctomycetaceae bacterium]